MTKLGVNLDHIATIREARKTNEPDPVFGAYFVELAGAHGVTIHLREDRRHIQDRDLTVLRTVVTKLKLNLEMAATDEMLDLAKEIKPDQVTLVPEKREEITTEGGLDIIKGNRDVKKAISSLKQNNIEVSLFIDPDQSMIRRAQSLGADAIEIHTGAYANIRLPIEREKEISKIIELANLAHDLGMIVHAGHGLTYQNVEPIAAIPIIEELNIGHSIIARAVYVGLEQAVREMVALISNHPLKE
jgi:pyridoxine 5-phosphate synthase